MGVYLQCKPRAQPAGPFAPLLVRACAAKVRAALQSRGCVRKAPGLTPAQARKARAKLFSLRKPTGRAAFVTFFGRFAKPKPVATRINAPLVAVLGEGDMVVLAFARENPDPKDATRKYTTTWFDMFRIEGGKIAEHWDPALKQ